MARHMFTVLRVRTVTEGDITTTALTSTWDDGDRLPLEHITDFDPDVGVGIIDPDGTPETFYFIDVDEATEELIGVTRPNATAHPARTFVQAGATAVTRKLADGFFDTDTNIEVAGVPIRPAVDAWFTSGWREYGTEEIVWVEVDEDDDDQPWIVSPPTDAPKTFDSDLSVLPPVGGGDSSGRTTDANSGKVLPPKGMGFEDGTAPTGTVVAEAFGGIGNTIFVNWTTIANSSVVNYEVHVSTSTGFTPSATTLYSSRAMSGESGFLCSETIKDFPASHGLDGLAADPPQPGTTYYIKIVPKDGSGAGTTSVEVSATPVATVPDGSITVTQIADGSISTPKLAANAVTAAKITAGTITATQIASATITGTQIAASTITASNLSVSTLSAITADLGTVTAGSITGVTITGGTLRTAASGVRVQISDGALGHSVRFFNASDVDVARISMVGTALTLDCGVSVYIPSKLLIGQDVELDGALDHDGTTVGFYGVTPTTRQTLNNLSGSDSTTAQLHSKVNALLADLRTLGLLAGS